MATQARGRHVVSIVSLADETIDALLAEEVSINGDGNHVKYLAAARAGQLALASWAAAGKGIIEKAVDGLRIRRSDGDGAASDFSDYLCKLRERGAELLLIKGGRPASFRIL